jgi:hypothetical protein
VDDVVPVEEVRDVRRLRVDRLAGEVDGEVEVEAGAPVRTAARVGQVVVRAVGVGVDVVPRRQRRLGAGNAVRVVPAERRGERVRRVLDDRPVAVRRAPERQREDVVARAVVHGRRRRRQHGRRGGRACDRGGDLRRCVVVDGVVLVEDRAGAGVDRDDPVVVARGLLGRQLPREADRPALHRLVDELRAVVRGRGLGGPETEVLPGRPCRLVRRRARHVPVRLRGEVGDQRLVDADDRAVPGDVRVHVGAADLDPSVRLAEIDVRDAVVGVRVLVGDLQPVEVAPRQPPGRAVGLDVRERGVERLAVPSLRRRGCGNEQQAREHGCERRAGEPPA